MVVKILSAVALVLILLASVISFQPNEFKISRSVMIAAAPAKVFAHVNDFRDWAQWSPWDKLDPNMRRTYEGPESGVGASYAWVGNDQVGEGKMTIVTSQPPELINIDLKFIKPMEGDNLTVFTFSPEGEGTRVTWTMSGKCNFVAKAFHLFMDMEKMVGPDFEKGLAQLKSISEAL